MTPSLFAHSIVQIRPRREEGFLPLLPLFCGGGSKAATIAYEPTCVSVDMGKPHLCEDGETAPRQKRPSVYIA